MELFFLILKVFLRAAVQVFTFVCELVALYIATKLLWTGEYINGAIVTASAALLHLIAYMCAARSVILLKKIEEHRTSLDSQDDD